MTKLRSPPKISVGYLQPNSKHGKQSALAERDAQRLPGLQDQEVDGEE